MTRRFLLPLERGDDETNVIAFARSLALQRHAELLLLRVEEWPLAGPFGFAVGATLRAGELASAKARLEEGGVPTKILSEESITSAAVLAQARQRAVSLIVVPYRNESAFFRLVHVHAAERVLRESPIPVLAVPVGEEKSPERIRRILYGYEHGGGAVPGLRHAIDFAQMLGASILLKRLRGGVASEEGFRPGRLFRGRDERERTTQDERSLEGRLLWILRRRDVSAQALPPAGAPVRDVLETVSRYRIDLVHLAATPDSERARLSLARHVLQEARIPVLVTREESGVSPLLGAGSRLRVGI
jgi:nucleotide-binding universal stress UspA family protein